MEQRKLIRLGNSSFAIALPKTWIKKSSLKKGDNIFITPNSNGELIIAPSYTSIKNEKKEILDFSNKDKNRIKHELYTAYVKDNTNLEVYTTDKRKRKEIKSIIKRMMNFEIIESDNKRIVAKDFFNIEETSIENFVRRMDNAIRSMFEDLDIGIKTGKLTKKQVDEIYDTDGEINKFYLLITKILFKGINNPSISNLIKKTPLELFNSWWIAFNLEHTGDELKKTAKIINEKNLKKPEIEKIKTLYKEIWNHYIDYLTAFYKDDEEVAKKLVNKNIELMNRCHKLRYDESNICSRTAWRLDKIRNAIYQINNVIVYGTGPA